MGISEVSEMCFSQRYLKSVIFAAVLSYLGEGKNSGNGAATSVHSSVSLGQRFSVTAALRALDSFCPHLLLLRGTPLRCCQCCYTFAAVIQCCSLSFATLWSCWFKSVCHHAALLALPSALGQGEAMALPWYIYAPFIIKSLHCIAIKQMGW